MIKKYTGVLAAADVFTASTDLHVIQSIRLDLGSARRSTHELGPLASAAPVGEAIVRADVVVFAA